MSKRRPPWMLFALLGAVAVILIVVVATPRSDDGKGSSRPRGDFGPLYALGMKRLQEGSFADAIEPLRAAVQIDSSQPTGHFALARAYLYTTDFVKAEASLDAILEDPEVRRRAEGSETFYRCYEMRGNLSFRLGDHERARADLSEAIRMNPDLGRLHARLSRVLLALDEPESALAAALRARELGHRTPESLDHLGQVYFTLGRHEEAVQSYRDSIRLNPGGAEAYRGLGTSLLRLGREEDGREMHRLARRLARVDEEVARFHDEMTGEGVESDQEYRKILDTYARYALRYRKYSDLSAFADQLIRLAPAESEYHYLSGLAKARLGEGKAAEEHLRLALKIGPDRIDPMNELSLLLAAARPADAGRTAESLEWAEKARAAGHAKAEHLAAALDAVGRSEEARRLVSWEFEDGEAWKALRAMAIERFQERVLQEPTSPPRVGKNP